MHINDVRLQQFRSYESARFRFDPALTLITGRNGAGKTNLLEAVYVLAQGGSFRVADGDLLRSGDDWWRLDATVDGEDRQVRYRLGQVPAKQLVVHDTAKRFTYKDRLPIVLFEPTDLQLIHGSPSRRRDMLDTILSALSQPYKQALLRYERALQQRNNILKKPPLNIEDVLFSWDVLLSEYGVLIASQRRELIDTFNTHLPRLYSEVAGEYQELKLVYRSQLPPEVTVSQYIAQLHHKLPLDKLRGTTSIGPHRDDFDVMLRGGDAKQMASRGEVRTSLLALKIAYANLLKETYGTAPVILLDDVFSELDGLRQTNLLTLLRDNQTIITDTKDVPLPAGVTIRLS